MGTSLLWQTDAQLHEAVQRRLDWEPGCGAHDVALTASGGVVALTGFVDSYAQKLAVEQTVKRVRGVRGVANDIQVRVRNEPTDLEIAKDVVDALREHTSVANQITVTVRNGFVTLEGAVEWMYQRAAAGSAVMYLRGVKGASNLIVVSRAVSTGGVGKSVDEAPHRRPATTWCDCS